MKAWPAVPGVPAAGHLTSSGFWHPGRIDGCPKCPRPAPRKPTAKEEDWLVRYTDWTPDDDPDEYLPRGGLR